MLLAPLALWVAYQNKDNLKSLAASIALGAIPAVLWTLFSLYYYGFPFPNTAYAKLGIGIPLDERFQQGIAYILHSIQRDPLTMATIVFGTILGIFSEKFVNKALSVGILLYTLYVASIGGDFMEGRFFTAPLVASAFLIAQYNFSKKIWIPAGIALLALGLFNIKATLLSDSQYANNKIGHNGIADERGFYYPNTGLLIKKYKAVSWKLDQRTAQIACGGMGFGSIRAGPSRHFVDKCALADPLLARLPAKKNSAWRIGHFYRQIPFDYVESLESNSNMLIDPQLKAYWESIRTITRGALNDPKRIYEIIRFRFNTLDASIQDRYRYGHPKIGISKASKRDMQIPFENLQTDLIEGTPWNAPGNIVFRKAIQIQFGQPRSIHKIELSLDHNDMYIIQIHSKGLWRDIARIQPSPKAGMVKHNIALAEPSEDTDTLRIDALIGDGAYSIGHLKIE